MAWVRFFRLCYLCTAFILPIWWLMSICLLCVKSFKTFGNTKYHEPLINNMLRAQFNLLRSTNAQLHYNEYWPHGQCSYWDQSLYYWPPPETSVSASADSSMLTSDIGHQPRISHSLIAFHIIPIIYCSFVLIQMYNSHRCNRHHVCHYEWCLLSDATTYGIIR